MLLFYYHYVRVIISFDSNDKNKDTVFGENIFLFIRIWSYIDQLKRKMWEKRKLWCNFTTTMLESLSVLTPAIKRTAQSLVEMSLFTFEFKIFMDQMKRKICEKSKLWCYFTTAMLESQSVWQQWQK